MNRHAIAMFVFLFPAIVIAQPTQPATVPTTPLTLEGAETFVYRDIKPEPLRLHLFKPSDWKASDHRPVLVFFFGGAWVRGTPDKSAAWARQAARWGMVGVSPDYRTLERFGTPARACVADARLSVRWVQEHAAELGIDPEKVVVGGNSAGGHLALWCAISKAPVGSDANESPLHKPAALLLFSAASDTNSVLGARRLGEDAAALSPLQNLDEKMPPTLMFHGDADKTVAYTQPVALDQRLKETGNVSELITIAGGSHSFTTEFPDWKEKSRVAVQTFLVKQGIIKTP